MKKILVFSFLSLFIIPIQPAHAVTCKQVANLEEQLRIASIKNGTFGLDTKANISTNIMVYRTVYKNPKCVSDQRYNSVVDVIANSKYACSKMNTNNPSYQEWRSNRDYWAGLYGKNFNYACSLWNGIK